MLFMLHFKEIVKLLVETQHKIIWNKLFFSTAYLDYCEIKRFYDAIRVLSIKHLFKRFVPHFKD
uniref:CSON006399 protein n=1 Tax=Culicoides sonorensis TaxID=179676 RepID=A0A336N4N5_CULSO